MQLSSQLLEGRKEGQSADICRAAAPGEEGGTRALTPARCRAALGTLLVLVTWWSFLLGALSLSLSLIHAHGVCFGLWGLLSLALL